MKLPYNEHGAGPAMLLLAAGVADRRMWDEHLEPLAAADHRVVAVDLPEFGEAAVGTAAVAHWDDVVETMDGLGIERAAIVGSSFGAAVGLRVAALHPERVSSLLLFSAPAVPEPDPSPGLLAAWDAEEEALAAGDVERAVNTVVSAWVSAGAAEEAGLLAAIDCPVLIAAGELDMVDFKDAIGELAARLGRATTHSIADCGHLAPLEAPDEFRRLVLANVA